MKKFLHVLVTLFSITLFSSRVHAQINCTQVSNANNCNIAATDIKSAVTSFAEVGGKCEATITLSFNLQHNSGMKFANLFFYNAAVNLDCKNGPSSSVPSSIASLGGYLALTYTTNWVAYTSGINGLTPQQTSYNVTATPITGGTSFVITGIKFTSGLPCGSYDIGLYLAGTNASSNGVQCHNQSSFKPYAVRIGGKIDCQSATTNLNYDLLIDANYENPTGTAAAVSGTYDVFIDANSDGIINTGDPQIATSVSFTTSTSGAPSGYTSRLISDNNYYTLPLGSPLSTKNLLVKVSPSTTGVASVTGILTNTCSTLPVSWKLFEVKQKAGKAELVWITEQESNNLGFEIQKRVANGQYVKVGFVDSKAANGTGAALSYSFNDEQVLQRGVTYYRLKQIDLDGRASYSEVKAVRTGNGQIIVSVYPNPSRGLVNVAIPESNSLMDVSLDDFTGKSIQRWSGIRVQNMQINNLKAGVYMLRFNFRESGETITQRIVVQ